MTTHLARPVRPAGSIGVGTSHSPTLNASGWSGWDSISMPRTWRDVHKEQALSDDVRPSASRLCRSVSDPT